MAEWLQDPNWVIWLDDWCLLRPRILTTEYRLHFIVIFSHKDVGFLCYFLIIEDGSFGLFTFDLLIENHKQEHCILAARLVVLQSNLRLSRFIWDPCFHLHLSPLEIVYEHMVSLILLTDLNMLCLVLNSLISISCPRFCVHQIWKIMIIVANHAKIRSHFLIAIILYGGWIVSSGFIFEQTNSTLGIITSGLTYDILWYWIWLSICNHVLLAPHWLARIGSVQLITFLLLVDTHLTVVLFHSFQDNLRRILFGNIQYLILAVLAKRELVLWCYLFQVTL